MFINYYYYFFFLHSGSGICYPVIKTCVFGSEAKTGLLDDVSVAARNEGDSGSSVRQAIKLIFCAAGLQVGILTEITVTEYKCIAACVGIPITPPYYIFLYFYFYSGREGCYKFVLV